MMIHLREIASLANQPAIDMDRYLGLVSAGGAEKLFQPLPLTRLKTAAI
jgi:hypothetical protein